MNDLGRNRVELNLIAIRKGFLSICLFLILAVVGFDTSATVYGNNDMKDIQAATDPEVLALTKSIAVQVRSGSFYPNGTYAKKTLRDSMVCESEPFVDQPVLANCTGFLVSPQHILTAGHCFMGGRNPCREYKWIFDFTMKDINASDLVQNAANIYQCVKIVKISYVNGLDYTLVELDRPVDDRKPLDIGSVGPVGSSVFAIHSPRGLPLKFSSAFIRENSAQNSFITNLDLMRGSSGAPVFDSNTLKVVGLVSNGDNDYELLDKPFCNIFKVCPEEGCRGETITRASAVPLKILLEQNPLESSNSQH